MSSSGGDQAVSSVIIAGCLKLKVVRIKGGKDVGSPHTQGPKAWKQYWVEFRVVNGSSKLVEYYEKKDQEKPKGTISLDLVVSVQLLVPHKKQQFMMECSDGQARVFETSTIEESYAWVTALNAVLFGSNMRGESHLEFSVALQPSPLLDFYGPCILVIDESDIVVYKKNISENHIVVRWKLCHLRSFRAKKDSFIVRTGSRTCTGIGEFYFSTKEDESVIITYAVEAVLAKLKAKMTSNVSNVATNSEPNCAQDRRSMLPPPPIPTDDLGILSPPMDTTQAPGHFDPGVGSPATTYVNVDQEDLESKPQRSNSQDVARGLAGVSSSTRRSMSILQTYPGPCTSSFDNSNGDPAVDSPPHLKRSLTNRTTLQHHLYCNTELDQNLSAETVRPPPPNTSSLYSVVGEEEIENRPSRLPPYDRLNRGVCAAILSSVPSSASDGYSKIQYKGADTAPCNGSSPMRKMGQPLREETHEDFGSNSDLKASESQSQKTVKTPLYDSVYEPTRSNSSGLITAGRPSVADSGNSNELHSIFGQFGGSQAEAEYGDIDREEGRPIIVEPIQRPMCNNLTASNNTVRPAKDVDGAHMNTIDQDIGSPGTARNGSRNKIPKPPPLNADNGTMYMTVGDDSDDYPPADLARMKPHPPHQPSTLCTFDKSAKPVTQQKECYSHRDKSNSFLSKEKTEIIDATYVLLTDEVDPLSTTDQNSTDDSRLPVTKSGRSAATLLLEDGLDNIVQVQNVMYGEMSDESNYNQKLANSTTDNRHAVTKTERSGSLQKDRGRDRVTLPKVKEESPIDATYALLTEEEGPQIATPSSATLPTNRSHAATRPAPADKSVPKPRPPLAPKPHVIPKPTLLPKPSVLAQRRSTPTQPTSDPQKKTALKPPVPARVAAKASLNQYEGNPPVPKPRQKVVPS